MVRLGQEAPERVDTGRSDLGSPRLDPAALEKAAGARGQGGGHVEIHLGGLRLDQASGAWECGRGLEYRGPRLRPKETMPALTEAVVSAGEAVLGSEYR